MNNVWKSKLAEGVSKTCLLCYFAQKPSKSNSAMKYQSEEGAFGNQGACYLLTVLRLLKDNTLELLMSEPGALQQI